MAADNTMPKEDSMAGEGESQPSALPRIVEPEKMDKILKYAVRRGLYAASFWSILYRTFFALHDYSNRNIDDADFTSTFRPMIFSGILAPTSMTVTVKSGKVTVSAQIAPFSSLPLPPSLKRWISGYSVIESRDAEIKSKEQLLALVLTFTLFRNFFVVIRSLPMGLLAGLARSLWATLRAGRSVPALIAILIVMFATGDAWRLFGLGSAWRCSVLVALIVTAGALIMVAGLRGWVAKDGWPSVIGYPTDKRDLILASWVKGTPAEELVAAKIEPELPIDGRPPEDLLKGVAGSVSSFFGVSDLRRNINILLGITVVADVVATFFWVSLAFVVVGILVVSESATKVLTGGSVDVILHLRILSQSFVVTRQLVLVSMVLGAIAALTFSAASMADSSSRATFSEYALTHLRRAVGAYAYYVGGLIALMRMMAADGTLTMLKDIDFEGALKALTSLQLDDPE
jgi:hypothetical protein